MKLIFVGHRWALPRMIQSAEHMGYDVMGILDKHLNEKTYKGIPVLGSEDELTTSTKYHDCVFHVASHWDGSNTGARIHRYEKIKLLEELKLNVIPLIHPTVTTCNDHVIGRGAYIDDKVHISNDCVIGPYSTIATGSIIGHDTIIHFNSQIGPVVMLTLCDIGHNSSIGAYSRIMHWKNKQYRHKRLIIGSNTRIFSDINMTKPVPDNHDQLTNDKILPTREEPLNELC